MSLSVVELLVRLDSLEFGLAFHFMVTVEEFIMGGNLLVFLFIFWVQFLKSWNRESWGHNSIRSLFELKVVLEAKLDIINLFIDV
jgi:hypothetical protein